MLIERNDLLVSRRRSLVGVARHSSGAQAALAPKLTQAANVTSGVGGGEKIYVSIVRDGFFVSFRIESTLVPQRVETGRFSPEEEHT